MFDLARHCDTVSEDPACPPCLRDWINYERLPASAKLDCASYEHILWIWHHMPPLRPHLHVDPRPALYATTDTSQRVRLTMASRLGDVGITSNLQRDYGYQRRVMLAELRDFSAQP